MLPVVPASWAPLLEAETQKQSHRDLDASLGRELVSGNVILPAPADIFNALAFTPYESVKVVLLGQDPYPTPGVAHGLCFSTRPDVRPIPASLRNIYHELHDDVGFRIPNHGCLEPWARQGMLMLNTILTVQAGQPLSHQGRGWEAFTDRIINLVDQLPTRVVFLLWGAKAQAKANLVRQPQHKIIRCAHPSPLSARRFFGCRCFSETNRYLTEAGLTPMDWNLADV
jgi:uracil-DNA glycosylase